MGFSEDRGKMLEAIRQGRVIHEERSYQEFKNVLAAGLLSEDEAMVILGSVRGQQAESSVHHYDSSQRVWIMKPSVAGVRWYLKAYLQEEWVIFLSFHSSEGGEHP